MQLDGWLRTGIERMVRGMLSDLSHYDKLPPHLFQREVKPALHPILITGSKELAAVWHDAIRDSENAPADLTRALGLVDAVYRMDRDICDDDASFSDLTCERLYWCQRYAALIAYIEQNPRRGYEDRSRKLFLADALLATGEIDRAGRLFQEIQSDPAIRIAFPFSSLLAIQRLAVIAEQRGELRRARELYRRFLDVLPALDVPLEAQLKAQRRAATEE